MTKWLKAFSIIFTILAIFDGMSAIGGAFAFLLFACNKNMYTYDLGEGHTVASLFDDLGIASRKELLSVLGVSVLSSALACVVLILLAKWFKKAYKTSDPFSTDLVKFLKKIAKFMLISSVVGFIIEEIIETSVDMTFNVSYETIFFGGLLAMCISYVLAYANVSRQVAQTENPVLDTAVAHSSDDSTIADSNNSSSNEIETKVNAVDENDTNKTTNADEIEKDNTDKSKNNGKQDAEATPTKQPRKRTTANANSSSKTTSTTRKRTTKAVNKSTEDNSATKTAKKSTTKQTNNTTKKTSKNSNNTRAE